MGVRGKHDCSTPESRRIAALQRVDVEGQEQPPMSVARRANVGEEIGDAILGGHITCP